MHSGCISGTSIHLVCIMTNYLSEHPQTGVSQPATTPEVLQTPAVTSYSSFEWPNYTLAPSKSVASLNTSVPSTLSAVVSVIKTKPKDPTANATGPDSSMPTPCAAGDNVCLFGRMRP